MFNHGTSNIDECDRQTAFIWFVGKRGWRTKLYQNDIRAHSGRNFQTVTHRAIHERRWNKIWILLLDSISYKKDDAPKRVAVYMNAKRTDPCCARVKLVYGRTYSMLTVAASFTGWSLPIMAKEKHQRYGMVLTKDGGMRTPPSS